MDKWFKLAKSYGLIDKAVNEKKIKKTDFINPFLGKYNFVP